MTQLYTPDTDVIDAVEGASWMGTSEEWQYIEDVENDTERAYDDALWEGDMDLAQRLKRQLDMLRVSKELGEQYVTSF